MPKYHILEDRKVTSYNYSSTPFYTPAANSFFQHKTQKNFVRAGSQNAKKSQRKLHLTLVAKNIFYDECATLQHSAMPGNFVYTL